MTPFGSEIYVGKHQRHRALWITPEQRSVTYDESMELSKLHIDESKAINLDNLSKWASEVCCFCIDFKSGKNMNVIDSTIVRNSSNVYKSYVSINSEYVGLDYWPMYCKYVFGSHSLSSSQFSVNCHHSYSLNRCFELDASTNCSDSYFAHNCEGLQDAMFCFNVKGKRHAIGNTELQSEQYRKIKETLVSQMADEIIKKKELKWDIFNIGCGKR